MLFWRLTRAAKIHFLLTQLPSYKPPDAADVHVGAGFDYGIGISANGGGAGFLDGEVEYAVEAALHLF